MDSKQFRILLLAAVVLNPPLTVQAALQSSEVAVLANTSFDGSLELAEYYCQVRGIPTSHIIALPMPDGELLGRGLYEKSIALQIRQALENMPPGRRIRCLVTVRGVPLRIGPAQPTSQQRSLIKKLRRQYDQALVELQDLLKKASRLAQLPPPQPITMNKGSSQKARTQFVKQTLREFNRAEQKIALLPKSVYKQTVSKEFQQIETQLLGLSGKIDRLKSQGPLELSDPRSAELADMQSKFLQVSLQIAQLMRPGATSDQFEMAAKLTRSSNGLLGLVQQIHASLQLINYPYEKSGSSFDSELSLVLAGEYPRRIFIPNRLCLDYSFASGDKPRTLMVSRIDGPSDAVARSLINMAVLAESNGLKGKAYIDTGWKRAAKGGYKYMERSLLATANMLTRYSQMPVTLDTQPEVFAEASCPDAALYCGWYSLKKYVDAFDWSPGAVGYHVASFELTSLRDPKYNGWATAMLRDGITATLGSVDEPTLASFPPPERFFTLLLTGQFSLVECFYMTKRFNSWQLVLIGDPLYNPFARSPRLTIPQAEGILKQKILLQTEPVPADAPAPKKDKKGNTR